MDGDQNQQRQYERQGFTRSYISSGQSQSRNVTQADVYGETHDPQRVHGAVASQPFRQPHMARAQGSNNHAMAVASAQRQDISHYSYPQYTSPELQGNPLQYTPRYSPETQSSLQFAPYTSQAMPQSMTQQPPTPYDPRPRYPARHDAAAIEVLSTQFGPHDVPPYYGSVDPTSTSNSASLPHHYAVAGYHQPRPSPYHQAGVEAPSVASNYVSSQMDQIGQSGASIPQQQQEQRVTDPRARLDDYQTQLKATFGAIREDRLEEASDSLLQISEWLLSNVQNLEGLTSDNLTMWPAAERAKLWDQFNLCWLGLLQRQKDNTEARLSRVAELETSRPTLSVEKLQRMGDQLISWCDDLERYGLVDYQKGVWEEEIESILSQDLDLLLRLDQANQGQAEAPNADETSGT